MPTGCEKPRLLIDIETFSSVDIMSAGSFRYMEAPDFEILLLAFAMDDEDVTVLDLTDEHDLLFFRTIIRPLLIDPDVVKVAHNSAFEREALRRATGRYMPPEQWEDTMIMAAMNGLPMSLDNVGAALRLKDQKIKEGATLIRYFCCPCKPTIANGGRTRNRREHAPDKWARFMEYCRRDVEVEQAIWIRLRSFSVPDWERKLRALDCRINEHGVMIDRELVESAVYVDARSREENLAEMQRLTGLENPNSVSQLRGWLAENGYDLDAVNKANVEDLLASCRDPIIRRVLKLRQLLGKTSTKKFDAMLECASPADDRIRGTMQYYGAGRTGRWAGRLIQVQNLPQNHLENIGEVREIVRCRDLDLLSMLYPSVPDTLSQLIRTALIAPKGKTFLVADYSAIEARVIAYLAGEKWRMEVFAKGGDIYCSSASQMFGVPVVKHGENGHLRQKGKIAELACGYGGGIGALKNFGADKMGLSEEEMQNIVTQWRLASPTIPKFWRDTENAARMSLENPGKVYRLPCGAAYRRDDQALRLRLPSGRVLSYWGAFLDEGKICFWAQNQKTRKWEKSDTWGGKLVENIVQAYARDCLAVAMLRLEQDGFQICFSVHDELICEEPVDGRTWEDMAEIMGRPIDWAPGLLLRADGYSTEYYMKD